MSVQSTFVGEMDRSFLEEKPPEAPKPVPEKSEKPVLPEEPAPVEKPKSSISYVYIAIIVICIVILAYFILSG